jgi:four helix bundle protein
MGFKRFEEIIAWQKAQELAVFIYISFKHNTDWDYRPQICRAVLSISNNIADSFERGSNTEFRRFLRIAAGSSREVKSML